MASVAGSKEIIYRAGETEASVWVKQEDLPSFLENHLVFDNQKQQLLAYLNHESE